MKKFKALFKPKSYSIGGYLSNDTHPHLLKINEMTPGIKSLEFQLRRSKFMSQMQENSIAIIAGSGIKYKTRNIFYPYHQNSDLVYLTGWTESDAICVFEKTTPQDSKFILFVPTKNKSIEMWDGPRPGTEAAHSFYGADTALPIDDFPNYLKSHLSRKASILCNLESIKEFDTERLNFSSGFHKTHNTISALSSIVSTNHTFSSTDSIMNSLKAVKSQAEIAVMRKCGQMSGRAFNDVLIEMKTGITEQYIAGLLEFGIRKRGGKGFAYEPVVASGSNALIIHYVSNTQILKENQLVLIDAGGEYGHYCSDISRTYPVNGVFSKAQSDLYSIILTVQRECIKRCKESINISLNELHDEASLEIKKRVEFLFKKRLTFSEFDMIYPHHLGHWLGMDVHDTPSFSRNSKLKGGHVVTIEPGIYIPDSYLFPEEYRGIGIRIEDDIVVGGPDTNTGGEPTVLSSEAPKEIADIEAFRK